MRKKKFICMTLALLTAFTFSIPYFGAGTEVLASAVTPLVAAGTNHSLALKSDGTLWAWGDNSFGQLGVVGVANANTPREVMRNVKRIAVDGNMSFAEISDNTVYAWGDGTPSPFVMESPSVQWNGQTVRSTSNNHALEIRDGENFWAWGSNTYGQLGIGNFESTPFNPANAIRITTISSEQRSSDGKYEYVKENNSVNITRYLGNDTTVTIPATLDNTSVLTIGESAFANNQNLQSVTIPSGVTIIGNKAFLNCSNLTAITLPAGLKIIGEEAFASNKKLAQITIPSSVTTIGERAFSNNNLLATAKLEHTNAQNLAIFGNNTTNNNNVFSGAASNFSIVYPAVAVNFTTPTWMGFPAKPDTASTGTNNDFEYTTSASGDIHITKYKGSAATVNIPASIDNKPVRRIEKRAFEYNTSLVNLTLPNSITLIGEQAFIGCDNLIRVAIPASVTIIEDRAFAGCSKLINARFEHSDASTISVFGNQVFNGASASFKITYTQNAKDFTTPLWKGYPAEPHQFSSDFEYRSENDGITITKYKGSAAVPLIPASFDEFPGKEVKRIDSNAFENNAHVMNIAIPNTVTTIGQRAFANCANLISVTIPASVTNIGNNAFRDNAKLVRARFEHTNAANITTFGSNVFDGHASGFVIIYPQNAVGFTQPTWQGYPTQPDQVSASDFQITTANGETTITKYNGSASYVDIPSHLGGNPVTKIGNSAFSGNNAILDLSIPSTVTAIGAQAFEYCSNLRHVSIPGSVVSIGYRAFGHCTNLNGIIIPASVTTIDNAAFADCNRLASAHFEHANANNITTFGENVFGNAAAGFIISHNKGATNFTTPQWKGYNVATQNQATGDWEYTVADGEATLTRYVGTANIALIPATLGNAPVKKIGDGAFEKASITSVTIPTSVTHIGIRAFSGCASLTHLNIPANVTHIGNEAFNDCARLAIAKFEHTNAAMLISFGTDVFKDASSVFKIIYPADAVGFTTPEWRGYPAEPEQSAAPTPTPASEPQQKPLPTSASEIALSLKRLMGMQPTSNATAIPVNFRVMFNGMQRQLSNIILNASGTTYLPLRALGEDLLGATVIWDDINSIAILVHNDTVVETFAGSNQVVVNGNFKDIYPGNPNQRVFLYNNSMYVPIRAVSEAFGFSVNWEASTQTILLSE